MSKDNILHYSIRLNMENEVHVRINKVLQNLNPQIYKSKNKFIVEALNYYIMHFGNDEFVANDKKDENKYVTKKEIEQLKKEITTSAVSESKDEVTRMLWHLVYEQRFVKDFREEQEM